MDEPVPVDFVAEEQDCRRRLALLPQKRDSVALVCLQRAAARRARAARVVAQHAAAGAASGADAGAGADADAVQVSAAASAPGLAFAALTVRLRAGTRATLLADASGVFSVGSVTGVLGASGSGKTTLLDALRGRSPGCALSGTVRVAGGGRPGFVPKEDILDRSLTPREALTLAAGLRGVPAPAAAAAAALASLGLLAVADTVLGGSATAPANVSGGQLKRVSIGVELVGSPRVLLLDEPTSGLDATAANDLLATLRAVARDGGVTVVAVLHQPRAELWRRLDAVLLLAGGGIVYAGAPAGFNPYAMRAVGVAPPTAGNPADHALDVITGRLRGTGCADAAAAGAALRAAWAAELAAAAAAAAAVDAMKSAAAPPPRAGCGGCGCGFGGSGGSGAPGASFAAQLWLQYCRASLVRIRAWRLLLLYFLLHLLLAAALSSGFSPLIQSGSYVSVYGIGSYSPSAATALQPYCPSLLAGRCAEDVSTIGLVQMLFFVSVACGIGSGIAGVQLFSNTLEPGRREADAGAAPLAAGLGRMLADVPVVFANGAIFCALWCALGASGLWQRWLAIYIGISWAASGYGCLVAQLTSPANASMLISISMLAFSVFNGTSPPMKAINPLPVVNWLWYISFASYVAQAVYYTYTAFEAPVRDVSASAMNTFGFAATDASFATSIGVMFALGFAWRIAALIALWAVTR